MSAQDNHSEQRNEPVVVGIGASAGGISSLQALFEALPKQPGAAFVIVIHLSPNSKSELAAILSKQTDMSVTQVTRPEALQANRIYVVPPDRQLEIRDNVLSAGEFNELPGHRAPIDSFFRSLADHGDGIAMVLSGAGSDGALGLKAVKEAGGIILVQDPAEAEYSSMPRAAIATGLADIISPVSEIAQQLPELIKLKKEAAIVGEVQFDEETLSRILAYLRVRTGHDFAKYKRTTVLRRISRRMQVNRTQDLKAYYDLLRDNQAEAHALLEDLLISVTMFFRDPEAFEALQARAIPELFEAKSASEPIRVWIAGCATGEEAYSIGILLLEEAGRREAPCSIQIFASDLDSKALAIGREGRYPATIEVDVTDERLRRFFTREVDGYRVRQELRDIVLFANHNLLKDPPFSRIDLISCRNVLIYLDKDLQEQLATTFHYALNPGGILFLGSAETADAPAELFRPLDRSARIYQSTANQRDWPRLPPRLLGSLGPSRLPASLRPSAATALSEAAVHRRAIERAAPPSVLVDETHRILHISDSAGRYLQPAGGALSSDLAELVRPELRFELRSALHRAFEQGKSTLTLPIHVRFNGSPHRVLLHVRPSSSDPNSSEFGTALVLFIEGEALEASAIEQNGEQADERVRRLSEELELSQSRLRTVREESEAANEELRAANEELQSVNEEYRSTSEELETSKEELQSINEELQTVNTELKLKLEAVSRAHSDLQNLMAATDFGTLFLDPSLRIKRFTERVTELFSLTVNDEGRPIADFTHQLEYDDLLKDARSVLADLTPIRRDIKTRTGRWYDVRLRPYRTVDDRIDGVVITFVDETEQRHIQEALSKSEQQLLQQKRLMDLSKDPIFIWDFDDGIVEWNRGCEDLYGFSRDEAIGRSKQELLKTLVPGSSFEELREQLSSAGSWAGELEQRDRTGRLIIVESNLQLEEFEARRLVLESARDITERKLSEERQRMLLKELAHRVKNTLAVAQSIAHHTFRTTSSLEDFVDRFGGRLSALSAAHGLLVQSDWNGADLAALARSQLEPYLSDDRERLTMEGEPILLDADLATPFGLVLHELATNAAKHGALSGDKGQVHLRWTKLTRNGSPAIKVVWQEVGGPAVPSAPAAGLGSSLIQEGIPGATVRREFFQDGLLCTIEVPLGGRHSGENA